jgi:hypothetical protein
MSKDRPKIARGSEVTRVLCGMPMPLCVTEITDELITCGPWTFDPKTGAEIDEELGWGSPPLGTGSFLKEIVEANS